MPKLMQCQWLTQGLSSMWLLQPKRATRIEAVLPASSLLLSGAQCAVNVANLTGQG
jgi:hypothetical protein